MKTRSIFGLLQIALFACALNLFGQGSLTPPSAPAPSMKTLDQIESRTPISSLPYTITESGSYYVTTNLYGVAGTNGITVEANDVTIDLNGYALLGSVSSSSNGIYCSGGAQRMHIYNGSVSGWGEAGIHAGRYCHIEQIRSTDNKIGIKTDHNSIIRDCSAIGCKESGIEGAYQTLITGCNSRYNGGVGIIGGHGSTIMRCTAKQNDSVGIYGFYQCAIANCVSRQNNGNGILARFGGSITDCVSSSNINGFYAGSQEDESGAISGSIISRCSALNNTENGIVLSSNSFASQNISVGNSIGLLVTGTSNRIEDNNITANVSGISVSSSGNFIAKNTASGNTNDYSIVGTQTMGPIITSTGTITNTNPWANFSF